MTNGRQVASELRRYDRAYKPRRLAPRAHRRLCEQARSLLCNALDGADADIQFHENGFYKATVWRDETAGLSLRVHVWPEGAVDSSSESNIHGHAWDFVSVVLAGHLRQTVFERAEEGAGKNELTSVDEFMFRAGSRDALKPVGHSSVTVSAVGEMEAGEVYAFAKHDLHRIQNLTEAGAASLVLTIDRESSSEVPVMKSRGNQATKPRSADAEAMLSQFVDLVML